MHDLWHRFTQWFLSKPPVEVRRVTADGYTISARSKERYRIVVHPRGELVHMSIDTRQHEWLHRLARLDNFDILAIDVAPDHTEAGQQALVDEADRLVRAAKAAWEHGWRPAVD